MEIAPIVIFSLAKYHHLKNLIKDIENNENSKYSEKYAFIDYASKNKISIVREYLQGKGYKCIFRPFRYGLYRNICEGVSYVLKKHEYAIFLEEDLRISRNILYQMTNSLKSLKDHPNVGQVHGHTPAIKDLSPEFFLRKSGSLCWGTWSKIWFELNHDTDFLIREIREKNLINFMNLDSPYNFYQMLIDRHQNKNDSWAIIFYANMILKNLLTFYPSSNSVYHAGFADGTNRYGILFPSRADGCVNQNIPYRKMSLIDVEESNPDYLIFRNYMITSRSFFRKLLRKIFDFYTKLILKKRYELVPNIDFYKGYHN